jgi:hypothetical protein
MIGVKVSTRQIKKVAVKIKKDTDTAAYRALNIIERQALKSVAKEITTQYPVKQKSIRDTIKRFRASKSKKYVKWKIKSDRLSLPRVKQLKKGIAFTGWGRKRVKMTEHIKGGSKPFLIPGRHSGKLTPVYREAGSKRTVTTIQGHSTVYLMEAADYQKIIRGHLKKSYPIEFKRQLKRVRF